MAIKRQPIIGLEVHVELKTKSKMFCSCLNDPDERRPNKLVCPVCMGHPGTLPVINEEAIRKVIRTGLALNCRVSQYSKFDRKNYFYPDLPKGYQISQHDAPLCRNGELLGVKIRRIHLEEDTGRLIHKKDHSLVDFNRAGIPLMELVTEPDIYSAKQAREFAEELRLILRYLGVSDADMEKGQLRVETNISLKGGPRVEVKNLNSFRAVEKASEYEIERQAKQKAVQETRGWDDIKGITVSQREKEGSHDYRYFAEPDLPPMRFSKETIEQMRAGMPELPQARRERFEKEYEIGQQALEVFTQNKDLGEYFEKTMSELRQWAKEAGMKRSVGENEFLKLAKLCSNYMITDLQGLLKGAEVSGENFRITPENFAEFIILINKGKISSKIAKLVLAEMFATAADPSHIIKEKGLTQITDKIEIQKIIKEVVAKNKKAVEDYKKGKGNALQFLVGQVMAKTKGRANPEETRQILLTKLE
jgi:aspartyl-tRNA(Asn)/glutamyl-tRNA(Gln) amidotransferase subunit B